jgi:hypothetical protein
MVDNHASAQLPQMVELHQTTHWHLVAQAVTEISVETQQVNMFQVAAEAQVVPAMQRLVELALTQIFLAQLLCMEVVVPVQAQIQDLFPQVEEVMTILQQQTEVAVDHNQLEAVV